MWNQMILKRNMCIDAINLYRHSMSQQLPYDKIKFDSYVEFEGILNTQLDSDFGYSIEVDFK